MKLIKRIFWLLVFIVLGFTIYQSQIASFLDIADKDESYFISKNNVISGHLTLRKENRYILQIGLKGENPTIVNMQTGVYDRNMFSDTLRLKPKFFDSTYVMFIRGDSVDYVFTEVR